MTAIYCQQLILLKIAREKKNNPETDERIYFSQYRCVSGNWFQVDVHDVQSLTSILHI